MQEWQEWDGSGSNTQSGVVTARGQVWWVQVRTLLGACMHAGGGG